MTHDAWALPEPSGGIRSRKVADLVASRMRKMIASGDLKENDWLPTEAELTTRFGVSRPTLREAFRLLEADGLVQIRRGPPGGARVTIPGPETAASLFGLILTLSGTTLLDVYEARMVIEPPAVRRLAESADEEVVATLRASIDSLRALVDEVDAFAMETTRFHLLLVQLSGNHTLASIVGMLSEITKRHIALGVRESLRGRDELASNNLRALRSYEKLLTLVTEGRGPEAEAFWRRHMKAALAIIATDATTVHGVVDVLD